MQSEFLYRSKWLPNIALFDNLWIFKCNFQHFFFKNFVLSFLIAILKIEFDHVFIDKMYVRPKFCLFADARRSQWMNFYRINRISGWRCCPLLEKIERKKTIRNIIVLIIFYRSQSYPQPVIRIIYGWSVFFLLAYSLPLFLFEISTKYRYFQCTRKFFCLPMLYTINIKGFSLALPNVFNDQLSQRNAITKQLLKRGKKTQSASFLYFFHLNEGERNRTLWWRCSRRCGRIIIDFIKVFN